MKHEVIYPKAAAKKIYKFPKLMTCSGLIVLMKNIDVNTEESFFGGCGTVICPANGYPYGFYAEDWNMDDFKDIDSSVVITLQNTED